VDAPTAVPDQSVEAPTWDTASTPTVWETERPQWDAAPTAVPDQNVEAPTWDTASTPTVWETEGPQWDAAPAPVWDAAVTPAPIWDTAASPTWAGPGLSPDEATSVSADSADQPWWDEEPTVNFSVIERDLDEADASALEPGVLTAEPAVPVVGQWLVEDDDEEPIAEATAAAEPAVDEADVATTGAWDLAEYADGQFDLTETALGEPTTAPDTTAWATEAAWTGETAQGATAEAAWEDEEAWDGETAALAGQATTWEGEEAAWEDEAADWAAEAADDAELEAVEVAPGQPDSADIDLLEQDLVDQSALDQEAGPAKRALVEPKPSWRERRRERKLRKQQAHLAGLAPEGAEALAGVGLAAGTAALVEAGSAEQADDRLWSAAGTADTAIDQGVAPDLATDDDWAAYDEEDAAWDEAATESDATDLTEDRAYRETRTPDRTYRAETTPERRYDGKTTAPGWADSDDRAYADEIAYADGIAYPDDTAYDDGDADYAEDYDDDQPYADDDSTPPPAGALVAVATAEVEPVGASAPVLSHRTALVWTVLGAVLPGLGLIRAQRKAAGAALLALTAVLVGIAAFVARPEYAVRLGLSPFFLRAFLWVGVALILLWVWSLIVTYRALQPAGNRRAGYAIITALAVLAMGIVGWTGVASLRQASLIVDALADSEGPNLARSGLTPGPLLNPWANTERVNLLLLGLNSGQGNETDATSIMADAIVVASIDTATGNTLLISVPRSLAQVPFPEGSAFQRSFPRGWYDGRNPSNPDYQLGAMYSYLPMNVDQQAFQSANLGADAMKLAVGAALDLTIDYYIALDLDSMAGLIDAVGGVTVNVNKEIPVTNGTLPAGADQVLSGRTAVEYIRNRTVDDDSRRMARTRCVVYDLFEAADLTDIVGQLTGVQGFTATTIRSDIPTTMAGNVAALGLKMRDGTMVGMQFVNNENGFVTARPNFPAMRETVKAALELSLNPGALAVAPQSYWEPQRLTDFCAYNPDAGW
jgi:LCP family protein required for cell wall assembly